MSDEPVDLPRLRRRLLGGTVASLAIEALLILGPAGRWDWARGWACLAVMVVTMAVVGPWLYRRCPAMLAARMTRQPGTKAFDKVFLAFFAPTLVLLPVVGGLDAGRAGSHGPWWTFWLGVACYALGCWPMVWAMLVNPFTESTVRIQHDRGHYVVDAGPYRYVRHPMYVGGLFVSAAWPLLLGSWWAALPGAAMAVELLVRTALEDRTLQSELPGYAAYATQTRWRILPGVW